MKLRLNNVAIVELVVIVVLGLITLVLASSAYSQFFLQGYINDALTFYHSGQKSFDRAENSLDKAKDSQPDYAAIYNVYAAIYTHPGKINFKKAEDYYNKTLKLAQRDRDKVRAHIGRAVIALYRASKAEKKGEKNELYSRAEDELDQAASLDPSNPDPAFYMWALFAAKGDTRKARNSLQELESILETIKTGGPLPSKSALITYYCQRGIEAREDRRPADAANFFRRAYRLDPESERIPQLLYHTLADMVKYGWTEENLEKKIVDVLTLEEILGLSPERYKDSSLVGLAEHRYPLKTHLGYAYARLAQLTGKKFGWFKKIKDLDSKIIKRLYKEQLLTPEDLIEKGAEHFKTALYAREGNIRKDDKTPMDVYYFVHKAKLYQIWVDNAPKARKGSYYKKMMVAYQRLSEAGILDPPARSRAHANVSVCAGYRGNYNLFEAEASRAIRMYPKDPRPLLHCAIIYDQKKREKKALNFYKKALDHFQKQIAEGTEFSEELLKLKAKAERRRDQLADKLK